MPLFICILDSSFPPYLPSSPISFAPFFLPLSFPSFLSTLYSSSPPYFLNSVILPFIHLWVREVNSSLVACFATQYIGQSFRQSVGPWVTLSLLEVNVSAQIHDFRKLFHRCPRPHSHVSVLVSVPSLFFFNETFQTNRSMSIRILVWRDTRLKLVDYVTQFSFLPPWFFHGSGCKVTNDLHLETCKNLVIISNMSINS